MTTDYETEEIQAGPVKRFFIDVLTRDIELSAAILDLVDNSVDSAHDLRPDGNYTGLSIDIEASEKQFTIIDNCAGITLDAARNYVFRLGRPAGTEGSKSSIGQFGVGMKRALFKIGTSFQVDSVTDDSHFDVSLDVNEWEKDEKNWLLDLHIHAPGPNGYPARGTTIIVDRLIPAVSKALQDMVEGNKLREELRSKHRMAIERGLDITLNGSSLQPTPTILAITPDPTLLHPSIVRFPTRDEHGNLVEVEIYAGVFAESETDEEAEPEDVRAAEDKAGWYVFGNDRLLLAANKTELTGWGGSGNMPMFHNQFSRFRGYVYMRASESIALPWNTMKTGVESADPVWIKVRGEMIKAGLPVIKMLNALKKERTAENQDADLPITAALQTTRPATVSTLNGTPPQSFVSPTPNTALDAKPNQKRIAYLVAVDEFSVVSDLLGETQPAAVGRSTWRYFVDHEAEVD